MAQICAAVFGFAFATTSLTKVGKNAFPGTELRNVQSLNSPGHGAVEPALMYTALNCAARGAVATKSDENVGPIIARKEVSGPYLRINAAVCVLSLASSA